MSDSTPAQPYHKESAALVEVMIKAGGKPYHEGSVEEARQRSNEKYLGFQGDYDFKGTRDELFIPSDEVEGGIPVFVYKPSKLAEDPPIYVYFHGGGMSLGSRLSVDGMCREISGEAQCIIVNVEYRLAPENKFPAAMDDACCVVNWLSSNKETVGGSLRSKLGVGGDSAGGCISASVSHDCPQIDFAVLIYPHVVARGDYSLKSYEEYINDPIISRKTIEWFVDLACDEKDFSHPRNASALRERFDKLPPTLFVVAQCDPLRDDSYVYQELLNKAGVHTELHLAEGALHAFYTMPAFYKELCPQAYRKTVDFIKRFGTFKK